MNARRRSRDEATELLPFDSPRGGGEPPAAVPAPRPAAPRPGSGPRRVFLGWDAPALPAAAELLLAERGPDLDGLFVALPGGRAVRRLGELLARRAPADWRPPRLVTQGRLVDELCLLERPAAGRLARTLAWRRALEGLADADVERIARGAGRRRDAESWTRLAETLRALHAELAPDGLDFAGVEEETRRLGHAAEAARWRALARAQDAYRGVLAAAGLVDPHEGRRAALEAGRVDARAEIVLVGVADMNELLAGVVERLGARASALVVAPEAHAAGFDALGRLVPAYWSRLPVPLEDCSGATRWFVEERPSDQADRAVDLVAGWAAAGLCAEEITVGLADDEVTPYLERRLREAAVEGSGGGARLRVAAGVALPRTRPFRLLAAVAALLERRTFAALAVLARHPDLAERLGGRADAAETLDRYHERHLPHRWTDDWPGPAEETKGVRALSRRLARLLGPLAGEEAAPLATWAEAIRALLERVYVRGGRAVLDPEVDEERVLAGALGATAAALDELEVVPQAIAGGSAGGGFRVHAALAVLLRALRGAYVPPAPARPGEPTLEGLGWLELALDDAPAMVVTGFGEGRVPRSVQGHAFLPDALRARLGLADDERRLARDVYATLALLSCRERVALVTGRRARSGDPLVPSRIAFQGPPGEPGVLVARVRRFLPPEAAPEPVPAREEGPPFELARAARTPRVERMAVTSFRTFLESPYRFYLEKVLRLKARDDRARELDPMGFGNLAHEVLEVFGTGELRDSTDAAAIGDLLDGTLGRIARERFGPAPLPAVAMQLEQLAWRLRLVAERQAAWRAEGWRIRAVEWQPEPGHPFDVDGEPVLLSGKIDRVDVHDDGRWAILDYKTGDEAKAPDVAARGKDGRWKDLQLPLYREIVRPLAEEHGFTGAPELGYFHLGKDEEEVGVLLARGWTEDDHGEALEAARDVVRRVRAGDFFDVGRRTPWEDEHVLSALLGIGCLNARPEDAEDREA